MKKDTRSLKRLAVCYINDEKLVHEIWKLAEDEERRERWEEEKKRRHEISLDSDEKVVTKIEYELTSKKDDFINGITKQDIYDALAKLDSHDNYLIELVYFRHFSEREVAKAYKCSQNAIHKRKVRILKLLRLLLDS